MDKDASRAAILQRIQQALVVRAGATDNKTEDGQSFFAAEAGSNLEIFARAFKRLQGQLLSCHTIGGLPECLSTLPPAMLALNWCCPVAEYLPFVRQAGVHITDDVMLADVVVTDCECLVARTGSVVLSAAQSAGRALPVYAPIHLTIAKQSQLLYDTEDAICFLLEKYENQLPSSLHFVAGPSRTGDIEKTLVMGVHGPKDVFVLMVMQ